MEDVLLPSVEAGYGKEINIVLIQNNSSVHCSRIVTEWIEEHNQITVLPWPSKTPELNPTENLWGIIMRQWGDLGEPRNIRSAKGLHNHAMVVWNRLRGQPRICENLVLLMPPRLQISVHNDGYT